MTPLVRQRCFIHANRQAAALCGICRRSFCRECVTEHEGRQTCAACLASAAAAAGDRKSFWSGGVATAAGLIAALIFSWAIFYLAGSALLLYDPSSRFESPAQSGLSK